MGLRTAQPTWSLGSCNKPALTYTIRPVRPCESVRTMVVASLGRQIASQTFNGSTEAEKGRENLCKFQNKLHAQRSVTTNVCMCAVQRRPASFGMCREEQVRERQYA